MTLMTLLVLILWTIIGGLNLYACGAKTPASWHSYWCCYIVLMVYIISDIVSKEV